MATMDDPAAALGDTSQMPEWLFTQDTPPDALTGWVEEELVRRQWPEQRLVPFPGRDELTWGWLARAEPRLRDVLRLALAAHRAGVAPAAAVPLLRLLVGKGRRCTWERFALLEYDTPRSTAHDEDDLPGCLASEVEYLLGSAEAEAVAAAHVVHRCRRADTAARLDLEDAPF